MVQFIKYLNKGIWALFAGKYVIIIEFYVEVEGTMFELDFRRNNETASQGKGSMKRGEGTGIDPMKKTNSMFTSKHILVFPGKVLVPSPKNKE